MTDIRIFIAMNEQRRNDTSFTDKGFFGFPIKFTQSEVREIWFKGIELGLEKGLHIASLEGQRIDITNSCKNEKHKEFYRKILDVCEEYGCAIQYHPEQGMCVIDQITPPKN